LGAVPRYGTVPHKPRIDRPVFFIGMPRSGTTVTFSAFATHPDLGWFTQYTHRFPRLMALAALPRIAEAVPFSRAGVERNGETWSVVDRLQINPAESAGEEYGIWTHCCGRKMQDSFLVDVKPTAHERELLRSKVAATLRYGGKKRFATKLTGPARIGFLDAAFDDAIFVHVVRDPRAVVGSLLRVPFWRDTYRLTEPAWSGGLGEDDLREWREAGESAAALAALEWRAVLELARAEAAPLGPDRYREFRYEDFIAAPEEALDEIIGFAALPPDRAPYEYAAERVGIRDLTENWRERLTEDEVRTIEEHTRAEMGRFGYETALA
jgi:omega-hydroxy-beta-dihydromenaquinone-9 sulfotransferase